MAKTSKRTYCAVVFVLLCVISFCFAACGVQLSEESETQDGTSVQTASDSGRFSSESQAEATAAEEESGEFISQGETESTLAVEETTETATTSVEEGSESTTKAISVDETTSAAEETVTAEVSVSFRTDDEETKETEKSTTKASAETTTQQETTSEVSTTAEVTYQTVSQTVYVVNTPSLNIRSGPGIGYSVVGEASRGETLHRTAIGNNGWSKIDYNGTTAYVSSGYVSITAEQEETTTKISAASYPLTYTDDTATITISKQKYAGSYCYIAHLVFTDYDRFATACGNGAYGSYETVSHAAKRLGAVFCVNGDASASSSNYSVVRSGVIYNDLACNVPVIYSSNTGLLCSSDSLGITGTALSALVSKGTVTDTFRSSCVGLVDGTVLSNTDTSRAQRTFIGTNGKAGDIYIVVSEGKLSDGSSNGLTYQECMELLKSKGCVFGATLDSGGNSTMYFNGTVLNSVADSERSVTDLVYFK